MRHTTLKAFESRKRKIESLCDRYRVTVDDMFGLLILSAVRPYMTYHAEKTKHASTTRPAQETVKVFATS